MGYWFLLPRVALRAIVRRPLQSAVVAFGWTAAFTATITIMGILAGVRYQVEADMQAIGARVINIHVSPFNLVQLINSPLRASDREVIAGISGGPTVPIHVSLGVVRSGTKQTTALFLVTEPELTNVLPIRLIEGRFLKAGDRQACVLDEAVAVRLFGERPREGTPWAVGKTVTLSGLEVRGPYRVVGIVKDPFRIRERMREMDFAATARPRILRIMEYEGVYLLPNQPWHRTAIHGYLTRVAADRDVFQCERQVREALAARGAYVWVWARARWIERVMTAVELSTEVANIAWLVVLVIATAMILSIALVAVRTRYVEIAVRRVEGARRVHIVGQLLLENVITALGAFLVALPVAALAGWVLELRYLSWPLVFEPDDVLTALLAGLVASLVATGLPAHRAASVDPVHVLSGRE